MIDLKEKLKNNEITYGSWVTLNHPSIPEIMAYMGFDWLTIDMEHSVTTIKDAQEMIRVIEFAGVAPLVRVGENNPNLIKRVMDAGAHGVIVPMINDRKEAEAAVKAVKYPPVGTRGVGLARAQKYGFGFEEYKRWVEDRSVVIVQIEHINAIENLEEILTTPGVDGSIIGPYDLSGSLGYPGEFEREDVQNAIRRYENVCRDLNKPMGFHIVQPDAETVKQYNIKGYSFMAVGLDTLYLGKSCKDVMGNLKNNLL